MDTAAAATFWDIIEAARASAGSGNPFHEVLVGPSNADCHAAYLASLLAELEVEATAVPPGDGGVGGEGGLAEDG